MVFTEFLDNGEKEEKIPDLSLLKKQILNENGGLESANEQEAVHIEFAPETESAEQVKAIPEPAVEEIDISTSLTPIPVLERSEEKPMNLNISLPKDEPMVLLTPKITVIGIGGAGGNAINTMIGSELKGARFLAANTDAQALSFSLADCRIQLGLDTTKGLGSGMSPEIGKAAAEEAIDKVIEEIKDTNMLFIAAGMGGGTGTGAAPVIAKAAKEMGILTVGVVTKPFDFEGSRRMELALRGIDELSRCVDTLIIIPNQNLFRVATEKTSFVDAFKMADHVLYSGVRNITDLIMVPGLINLDFADVRAVVKDMGRAMMGSGEATGENRAIEAAEAAITNQLLDDNSMKGAKGVLINITGGPDLTLMEVDAAAERIRAEVDTDANIKFGTCLDPSLEDVMRVSVVATGITGSNPTPVAKPASSSAAATPSASVRTESDKPAFGKSTDFLKSKTDLFGASKANDSLASAKEELDRIFARVQENKIHNLKTDTISEGQKNNFDERQERQERQEDTGKDETSELPPEIPVSPLSFGQETVKVSESAPSIPDNEVFIPEIKEEDEPFTSSGLFSSQEPVINLYEDENEGKAEPQEVSEPVLEKSEEPKEKEESKSVGSLFKRVTKFTLGKHKEISEEELEKTDKKEEQENIDFSSEDFSIPAYLRRN